MNDWAQTNSRQTNLRVGLSSVESSWWRGWRGSVFQAVALRGAIQLYNLYNFSTTCTTVIYIQPHFMTCT